MAINATIKVNKMKVQPELVLQHSGLIQINITRRNGNANVAMRYTHFLYNVLQLRPERIYALIALVCFCDLAYSTHVCRLIRFSLEPCIVTLLGLLGLNLKTALAKTTFIVHSNTVTRLL